MVVLGPELINKLHEMYDDDEVARELFDSFAKRQRDVEETTVENAARLCRREYSEVRPVLQQIAQTGAGTFRIGRRGSKSRIIWEYSLKSIGRAARGEGELQPMDEAHAESECDDDQLVTHTFMLRERLTIRFSLPENLTESESNRLWHFVTAIPFRESQEGEELMVSDSPETAHELWLRPGFKFELSLPTNLTSREADRLGSLVHALPFD